nr:hypothetical protein [Pelagicoccus mobilis]
MHVVRVELGGVGLARGAYLPLHELALVGVGFEVGGVGEDGFAVHELPAHGLQHDSVEDLLVEVGPGEAIDAVSADGGVVGDHACDAQPEKPVVGEVDLHLLLVPLHGAYVEEVPQQKHLEEHDPIDGGTPVLGAVEMLDLAKQVVLGDERFDVHELQFVLPGAGTLEHPRKLKKLGQWPELSQQFGLPAKFYLFPFFSMGCSEICPR